MRFEQMAFATYLQENANLVLAWRTVGHLHTFLGLTVGLLHDPPPGSTAAHLQGKKDNARGGWARLKLTELLFFTRSANQLNIQARDMSHDQNFN